MKTKTLECIASLVEAGIAPDDAYALRRVAIALHRWHELECGVTGPMGSQSTLSVERDGDEPDSPPFQRLQYPTRNGHVDKRTPCPDREAAARKRLAKIMARYPALSSYIQGDPRGAALYILRPGDVPAGKDPSTYYSRGLAVYK